MTNKMIDQTCSCPCGKASFQVKAKPITRFYCHCTICQTLYQKPFSDVTILWWKDIEIAQEQNIIYNKYRSFPAINRGTCAHCKAPILAYLGMGPIRIAFTDARNFSDAERLKEASMHIFYNSRTNDANDDLPKYEGYMKSEAAVFASIARGALG